MWLFKSKSPAKIENSAQEITELEQLADIFNVPTQDGITVSARTAISLTSVYACVRLIAGNIASMPVKVYKRDGEARSEASDHKVYSFLHDQPSPVMSAYTFWESTLYSILLEGNGYAEIIRENRNGDIGGIRYIPPTKVTPRRDKDIIWYKINDEYGERTRHQDDILHFPGIGFDGTKAKSVIYGNRSISTAIQAEIFSEKYFKNGTHIGGYLRFPNMVKDELAKFIKKQWMEKFGGAEKAHAPAVIPEGGEYVPVAVNARDAQIIEARRYQVADIARIFGVPLFMINETEKSTSWGTGIEQQSIGYVRYTLQPHINRIEHELNRKLFSGRTYFAEFYTNALMKGDTKARNESYQIALGGNQQPGWMTINEVRKIENLPPIPGGDELYKPITGEAEKNEESPEPTEE